MNYETAKEKILKENLVITKSSWGLCKTIRQATLADEDYINYPHQGVIVEDCSHRNCDCKIAIHQPAEEDKKAEDYVIAI